MSDNFVNLFVVLDSGQIVPAYGIEESLADHLIRNWSYATGRSQRPESFDEAQLEQSKDYLNGCGLITKGGVASDISTGTAYLAFRWDKVNAMFMTPCLPQNDEPWRESLRE